MRIRDHLSRLAIATATIWGPDAAIRLNWQANREAQLRAAVTDIGNGSYEFELCWDPDRAVTSGCDRDPARSAALYLPVPGA